MVMVICTTVGDDQRHQPQLHTTPVYGDMAPNRHGPLTLHLYGRSPRMALKKINNRRFVIARVDLGGVAAFSFQSEKIIFWPCFFTTGGSLMIRFNISLYGRKMNFHTLQ